LAWCLDALGDADASREALEAALARDPLQRSALALGLAQAERALRHEHALGYAERIAAASPADAGAHYNLGVARARLPDRRADAEAAWRRTLSLEPAYWPALLALGRSALERSDAVEAALNFQAAATLAPGSPEPWFWLGLAELRRNRGSDALSAFRSARALAPDEADVWRGLAEAAELAGEREEALAARRRELALRPGHAEAHWEAAGAYSRLGLDHDARAALERAATLAPERLLPRWLSMQLLPRVYRDEAEQRDWHARWLARLAEFERLDPADPAHRAELPQCLSAATNFSLHYLGGALREEQSRYGALLTRWTRALYPGAGSTRGPRREGRLRVGFASAHLRPHTISKLFGAWLADLDRARFEVVAMDLGRIGGAPAGAGDYRADHVLGPYDSVERWHEALQSAGLDALIWLDVGMDGTTQALTPIRWAPVPVRHLGPPGDDRARSDRLFPQRRAHGTRAGRGSVHGTPGAPARARDPLPLAGARAAFGARAAPGRAGPRAALRAKHLQAHARALRIVRAPRACAARGALRVHSEPIAGLDAREALAEPFRAAFRAQGQDFDARATVHPFLDQASFFTALARADVLSDTVGWSGGNTTLEALATGLAGRDAARRHHALAPQATACCGCSGWNRTCPRAIRTTTSRSRRGSCASLSSTPAWSRPSRPGAGACSTTRRRCPRWRSSSGAPAAAPERGPGSSAQLRSGLYLMRCGFAASSPSRRRLSASYSP
jgi:tetratricopeptide (TPR) repeat protein